MLRISALTVTSGVLAMACSSDDPTPDVEPEAADEEQAGGSGPDGQVDIDLLNTALSIEVLAIDTYQVALDLPLIESRASVETARLFQEHHRAHRDALVAAVRAAGGEPFTTANPVVKVALVDPSLVSVAVERDFVMLAHELEGAAAQLYVHATTVFRSPDLRSLAMSIGAVTSRQATILDLLGELGDERPALVPTDNPLPSDAVVTG